MKSASKCTWKSLFALTFIAFCAALTVQGQTSRDKYIISAKAGGVNYVAGNVTVERKGAALAQALTAKDDLEAGDVVTTGMGGRVEVLLNPGSYLRVSENAEFELTDTTLDHLRIRLAKGSAVVEATGADGLRLLVEIITPQTRIAIIRRGLYRVDVLPSNITEVKVRKGRALVESNGQSLTLKGDRMVAVGRAPSEIAKFDKKNQDGFDVWSKQRAETLAEANRSIQSRTLIASLRGYDASWSGYDAYGLWVYNRRFGCYSFYPFNSWGWSSPYGYGYYNGGYPCWGCGGYRPNPSGNNQPPNPGSGGVGGGGGNPLPPPSSPPPGGNPGRRGPREPIDNGPGNPGYVERGGAPLPSAPVRETPVP